MFPLIISSCCNMGSIDLQSNMLTVALTFSQTCLLPSHTQTSLPLYLPIYDSDLFEGRTHVSFPWERNLSAHTACGSCHSLSWEHHLSAYAACGSCFVSLPCKHYPAAQTVHGPCFASLAFEFYLSACNACGPFHASLPCEYHLSAYTACRPCCASLQPYSLVISL